jgi:hypothetical protein
MGDDIKEKIMDMVLDIGIRGQEKSISEWDKLRIMNQTKDSLCSALLSFMPDLPRQYSSQVESIVQRMEDSIQFIFDIDEFEGFLSSYKLNVDRIVTMLDPWHREQGDIKRESFDDMANIRAKMQHYQSLFEKLYAKVLSIGMQNIDLERMQSLIWSIQDNNNQRVDRQQQKPSE